MDGKPIPTIFGNDDVIEVSSDSEQTNCDIKQKKLLNDEISNSVPDQGKPISIVFGNDDVIEVSSDSEQTKCDLKQKRLLSDEISNSGIFANPFMNHIQDDQYDSDTLDAEEESAEVMFKCLGYGIRLSNFSSFSYIDKSRIRSWLRNPMMENPKYRESVQKILDEGGPLITLGSDGRPRLIRSPGTGVNIHNARRQIKLGRHKRCHRISVGERSTTPSTSKHVQHLSPESVLSVRKKPKDVPLSRNIMRLKPKSRVESYKKCERRKNDCPSGVPLFEHSLTASELKKSRMTIPSSFWNSHLKKWYKFYPDVELRMSDKRWVVSLKEEKSRRLISKGFKKILQDMSLRAGSVMVFKLINSEPIVMDVFIKS